MPNAVSGKIAHLGLARQPGGLGDHSPLVPDFRVFFSAAPSLLPIKNRARLAATNRTRDVQPGYTSSLGFGGDFQCYAHPQVVGPVFYGGLGVVADSGADPNFEHVITPGNHLPYWKVFLMVGDIIYYVATDVIFDTVSMTGDSSSPMVLNVSSAGIRAMLADLDPTDDVVAEALVGAPAGYMFMEAEGQLLINGVATRLTSFSLEVNNNASPAIADGYFPYDIDVGEREVTLGYATRFTNLAQFKEVYFNGGVGGNDMTPAVTEAPHQFTWTRDTDTEAMIYVPHVTTVGFPVQPDPGGAPITVDAVTEVNPDPAGVDDVVTVTVRDQRATY